MISLKLVSAADLIVSGSLRVFKDPNFTLHPWTLKSKHQRVPIPHNGYLRFHLFSSVWHQYYLFYFILFYLFIYLCCGLNSELPTCWGNALLLSYVLCPKLQFYSFQYSLLFRRAYSVCSLVFPNHSSFRQFSLLSEKMLISYATGWHVRDHFHLTFSYLLMSWFHVQSWMIFFLLEIKFLADRFSPYRWPWIL